MVYFNFLKGNLDKYSILVLGRKPDNDINVVIDHKSVTSTDCLELLGVFIDRDLHFDDEHISIIYERSSQHVGVLMQLRNIIPPGIKLQLINFCCASDSRKLERVQERALRATYCDESSYGKLLSMANINLCTLRNRLLQDIAVLMYKTKKNIRNIL